MAIYNWFGSNGSFSSANNWTPVGTPGIGDTAYFVADAYTVTGVGAVSLIDLAVGFSSPMRFDGSFSADNYLVVGRTLVSATGTWTVTGNAGTSNIIVADDPNTFASLGINGTVRSTASVQPTAFGLYVGSGASGTNGEGTVYAEGATAVLDTGPNAAMVGGTGQGILYVMAGAHASFTGNSAASTPALAVGLTAIGTVNVGGTSSAASSIVANGYVYIGHGGTGTLNVSSFGSFTGGSVASGATPAVGITIGDGSATLDTTGTPGNTSLYGGQGYATVTSGTLSSLGDLRVGYDGSAGQLQLTTAGSATSGGQIMVGGGTDHGGSQGIVSLRSGSTLQGGGTHTTGVAGIVLGSDATTTGTVSVYDAGSILDANADRLTVGDRGRAYLGVGAGGKVLAGSANYSDREAALAVGASAGGAGTLTIDGSGSQLIAAGDAVIGGNELNGAVTRGGTAVVTVTRGGLLQAAYMTVLTGGSVSVDRNSTLNVPNILIDGGSLTLNSLAGTTITFGDTGSLFLASLTGTNAISTFNIGDKIDLLGMGGATLSNNIVSVGSGSLSLNAAPTGYRYALSSDGSGGTFVKLIAGAATPTQTAASLPVSRFFSNIDGGHFFTFDPNEIAALTTAGSPTYRPDLTPESGGFGAIPAPAAAMDPNSIAVYRFFDTTTGAHFFTDSTGERDSLTNPLSPAYQSNYVYEPNSTFYEHVTKQASDVAVYRFFNTTDGTHFYTGDQKESDQLTAPGTATFRPDLIAEGIAFYAPASAVT